MLAVIPAPRPELKPHAPRITVVQIPVDKIGAVIGPGGKIIRSIQEETGAKIDIEDDGTVYIAATDGESARKAARAHRSPDRDARHRAHLHRQGGAHRRFRRLRRNPAQHRRPGAHLAARQRARRTRWKMWCSMGDEITVMVTDIDPQGKIRLSRQAVLEGWTARRSPRTRPPRGGGRRWSRPAAAIAAAATATGPARSQSRRPNRN